MKSKDQQLLEEAYGVVNESYQPYSGSDEDLVWVEDLDSQVEKLKQAITNGAAVVLKHAAFKEDLDEMGMKTSDSSTYLFDRATDFTQPVFIIS